MALFKRARGCCACGKELGATTGKSVKALTVTCTCGQTTKLEVSREWWASYRDPDGQRVRIKGLVTKEDTLIMLDGIRKSIAAGTYSGPRAARGDRMTLAGLVEAYFAALATTRKAYNLHHSRLRTDRVVAAIGKNLLIDDLTSRHGDTYREKRTAKGTSPATINCDLANVSAAMRWARDKGLTVNRPTFRMATLHNARTRFLTREEAATLIQKATELRPVLGHLVRAALASGARLGELTGAEWSWLNLEAGFLTVPSENSKTGRVRNIPVNSDFRQVLLERRDLAVPGARIFHQEGRRCIETTVAAWFRRAATAAGLGDDVVFHSLRHSAASWAVLAGVPLHVVAKLLGHSTTAMTERYSHLSPHHVLEAADHLLLAPPAPPPEPKAEPEPCHQDATGVLVALKPRAKAVG